MEKNIKRLISTPLLTMIFSGALFLLSTPCWAHFGMIIPSSDIIESQKQTDLNLKIMFAHPFEGHSMDMEKPVVFGVFQNGQKTDLIATLKPLDFRFYNDTENHKGWQTQYKIKRPGDYIFYVEPKPYWEPAENCYIIHYTKVIVDAYGKSDAWDKEIGLKTEIVPLTRPYGLYQNNVFQGIVKLNGEPAPDTEVEVEYFNENGTCKAPSETFMTQIIKSDQNGIFTFAMPRAGWWGFAALNEDEKTIPYNGEEKAVEIGAVLWVKTYRMKENVK